MSSIRIFLLFSLLFAAFSLTNLFAQATKDAKSGTRNKYIQVSKFLKSAKEAFESGNYDKATQNIDSILAVDASNPDAVYYKAKILVISNDTAQAISALKEGVTSAPRSSKLNLLLARLELSRNMYSEAMASIENILMFRPRDGEALYLKGKGLLLQGDTLQAAEILEKALEISITGKK